jgi:hypothetical protein
MDKKMMLYTTATNGTKTFGMIPLVADCPFNEVIYMPSLEALAVLSKNNRDTFTMLERLDENGNEILQSGKNADVTKAKMQRVQLKTSWEYFIHEKNEILEFINLNAVNNDTFPFLKYLTELEIVENIVS